jgi:crotonobetainyl-CoA:carnitine CoA-transferase CaiB-like acyl-CoA transferase
MAIPTAPLVGVRVLDFTRVLAGPYGSLALADLGADVVKVEHPEGGDDTRSYGPPFMDGLSTYFLSVNRGKRSVALDLKVPADLARARALALAADVVFSNFRPGVMERLGLGAESLRAERPDLIVATIQAFDDPEDPRPGYDLLIQGLSGIPAITGPPDGEPFKCAASIADLVSGMNATIAILAALHRRSQTGEGATLRISLHDSTLSLLTYHAGAWLNAGVSAPRMGNHHRSIHPFGTYPCADGHINLCIGNDHLWRQLCTALGEPERGRDPQSATNPARVANREALDSWLISRLAEATVSSWVDTFGARGIPCGPILSVEDALEGVPTQSHPHPLSGRPVQSLRLPFSMDGAPRGAPGGPPLLGEHTASVWEEWCGNADR